MKKGIIVLLVVINCGTLSVAQENLPKTVDLSKPIQLPSKIKPNNWPAANLATCDYGFFCKQELKADKVTPMPIRFRLGNKEMTDWLESKPGAVRVGN